MERKKPAKPIHPADIVLDVNQACNEFQLLGTTRIHVLKKFKGQTHSINYWTEIFQEQRIT
jgi:hypothetical protein